MNNLGQLLNNIDLNQVMGQLSQMMGGPQGGSSSGPQRGPQGNSEGGFQGNPQGAPYQPPKPSLPRDPRMQILQAMKPFLSKRRSVLIDNIGQLYTIVNMIQGFNKMR